MFFGVTLSIPIRNVAKMATSSLMQKAFGTRRPLNVMLALTDRCTGKCAYCKIPERKSPEMTKEQICTMLDQAARAGCQRLGIWGGEPLVRKDIASIVRHAKSLGMFVTIDTNGHLIPKREAACALADHLNISLNGNREAHDRFCGEGSFDKTMKGIELSVGRFRFWTITVLTRANLDQIDWILGMAEKYGFLTTFQALHHNDELGHNDPFYPEDAELRKAARALLSKKRAGAPIASSEKYLEHLVRWPDYKVICTEEKNDAPGCLAGKLYCNVDVDGTMYPCSLLIDPADKPPNVLDHGFQKAFESLAPVNCNSCLAACFTEYNLLYNLDVSTGLNWVRALRTK